MNRYYIPYHGDLPLSLEVKGHKLLFIATDINDIIDSLPLLGSPNLKRVDYSGDEDEMMALLAEETGGGVILAPPGMNIRSMVEELQMELPWLH